jgi:hypothetical protein
MSAPEKIYIDKMDKYPCPDCPRHKKGEKG